MSSRQYRQVAILVAMMLVLILAYCGLFDWTLYEVHTTIERGLGETPKGKLEAYLNAVRTGESDIALACWPAREHLGAHYKARRQQVTEQLLTVGPSLRHHVLKVEWWRTCCEPGQVTNPDIAGMARMRVEITDGQGRPQLYTFDIGTTKRYWADAGGDPVRRWVLWDVYRSGQYPLVFHWPLEGR